MVDGAHPEPSPDDRMKAEALAKAKPNGAAEPDAGASKFERVTSADLDKLRKDTTPQVRRKIVTTGIRVTKPPNGVYFRCLSDPTLRLDGSILNHGRHTYSSSRRSRISTRRL